jgi:hypothetical protein
LGGKGQWSKVLGKKGLEFGIQVRAERVTTIVCMNIDCCGSGWL